MQILINESLKKSSDKINYLIIVYQKQLQIRAEYIKTYMMNTIIAMTIEINHFAQLIYFT